MRKLSVLCKKYLIYPVRYSVFRVSLCIFVSGIALRATNVHIIGGI